jgi:predicted RNase H-like HicB family nuclease
VSDEQGQVLAIGGNVAVTHLVGRAFPGVHMQGDTFANLRQQIADVARRLRRDPSDDEALDDLDYAVEEMTQVLQFYETVLAERDMNLPYVRESSS